MSFFQHLTRSSLAINVLMLILLTGFSGVAFADEDMMEMKDKKDMMGMKDMMGEKEMMGEKMMDEKGMMGEKGMMDGKEMMGMVNVNTATAKQLETLPGIGEGLAKRIIDYRTENGKFKSVQELVKVKGIGKETLAKMEDRLTMGHDESMSH